MQWFDLGFLCVGLLCEFVTCGCSGNQQDCVVGDTERRSQAKSRIRAPRNRKWRNENRKDNVDVGVTRRQSGSVRKSRKRKKEEDEKESDKKENENEEL